MAGNFRTIPEYNTVDQLAGDDLFLVYDTSNQIRANSTMADLSEYVSDGGGSVYNPYRVFSTYEVPTDGTTNSLTALQNLFNGINETNTPFKGLPGRYVLSGVGDIEVKVDADFTGMVFDVSAWNGEFQINRRETSITYTAGDGGVGDDVINAFEGSTNLGAGSSYIDGWASRTECDDAFIAINTDQDFYQYRDDIIQRSEFNHVWSKGVLNSPLRYSMSGVNITSIVVYPLEEAKKSIIGLTLDVGDNDIKTSFVRVQTSFADVKVKFLNAQIFQTNSLPQLLFVSDSAYVNIDIITQEAMQGDQIPVAYALGGRRNYDLKVKLQCDGDGWGCMNVSETRRLTFYESTINRIDCHEPFYDFLKVKDCTLGERCFEIVGAGDIIIEDCLAKTDDLAFFNTAGSFITGRLDTGGWIDGDLYVRNLRIETKESSFDFFLNQQTTSGDDVINAPPSGSPINFRFFRNIVIDNVYTHSGDDQTSISFNPTRIVKDGNMLLTPFETFALNNTNGMKSIIKFDFTGLTPSSSANEYSAKMEINNSTVHIFQCFDDDSNFNVQCVTSNVTPWARNFSEYEITAAGKYTLKETQMHRLAFENDSSVAIPSGNTVTMNMFDSSFKGRDDSPTSDFLSSTLPSNVKMIMYGGTINANVSNQIENMFARDVLFYSTSFLVLSSVYRPEAEPWRLFKHEFLNEQQILASQSTPHSFAAASTYENTTTQTALFQVARNGYVNLDLLFTNQLNIEGTIVARVVFEGTNNGGTNYTIYSTVNMGYIGKSANANTGGQRRASARVFLSRNTYEQYRATLQLRCGVISSTPFPLSQGGSLIGGNENEIRITYS